MPETSTKGFGFLGNKVGPLPLWVWIAAGIVVYYYMSKKNSTAAAAGANQQTDPAGNIGSIDPATGYVYGTPEDTAALAANNGTGSSSGGSTDTSTSPGQRTFTDNNTWGIAAVNYLVSLGVDASAANQAITLYLGSQSLTTQQQAMVNEAIQALGAPPTLPGPSSSNPGSVTGGGGTGSGGGGGGKGGGGGGGHGGKPLAPKNLKVANNTGKGVQITWDLPGGAKTSNAGWRVENHSGSASGPLVDNFTTQNTIANLGGALVHGGLKHGGRYTARVRENVNGAPWGSVSYVAK